MSPHVMQVEGYYNQLEKRIKQLELLTGLSSTNHAHQVWIFVTIVPQSLTPLTMFLGVFKNSPSYCWKSSVLHP
jgi:hypothetical protein